MLGGKSRTLLKRFLAFFTSLTMVITLVNASTIAALAAEADTNAVEALEEVNSVEGVEPEQNVEMEIENSAENDEAIELIATDNLLEAEELDAEELGIELLSDVAKETKDYSSFTNDEVVFDGLPKKDDFSDIEYNTPAVGWSGNVYYPRVPSKNHEVGSSYVKDAEGSLEIMSKVWTETESSGYGVYTYENTSSFDMELDNADYLVEVTLKNPTASDYVAYLEAEDITKASGITVAANASTTASFTACLVDGILNIKFLTDTGAKTDSAETKSVFVSNVKITRLATNEPDEKTTIFVASDSTVQSYDSYYYPQTGWGQVLADCFGGNYEEITSPNCGYSQAKRYDAKNAIVENRAIGGRSSSSFVTEGKLDDLLEDVAPGDYLLIQWGHNDATYSRPNRYVSTTADTDKNGVNDFEQWLQYYVDGAIQRGATPVLVTPVARYSYVTDAEGNLTTYASNFEAYRQVMIKMSMEQGIALVDLTQRSIDIANSFGIEGGKSLWLWVDAGDYTGAYAGGVKDSTHLQWYGAFKFAQQVATGIKEAGNSQKYNEENYSSEANKAKLAELGKLVEVTESTTAPGKVSGLTAGTVGASSVSMTWDVEADSELYYIYRAKVDSVEAGEKYVFADDAAKYSVGTKTKYNDAACEAGTTYVYAVRGFNSLGLGEYSDNIVVTTKDAGLRFDFNYNNSKTQLGWIGINQNQIYDATLGYGWSATSFPNNGRSRGNNGTVAKDLEDMAGDFNLGNGVFNVDLPNGDYEITVYAADLLSGTSTIKTAYKAEGIDIGGCSCKQSLASVTATVRVNDGQLNLTVGGTNAYINGLTITELLLAPTSLVETEASVEGSQYTFLIGFNGVDVAAGYNVYQKGSTDADFKKIKSFTIEEYAADELSCRAMACKLGEDYEYYVTCYTADGTESAPSNTITVKALLSTVEAPKAPANIKCVSPSKDDTEIKYSITLSWDESEVVDSKYPVLKYIVYRSDKPEGSKGFTEFVKVGETATNSFTDNSEDIATNVHYYYKVCGSNAGGAGELSEVCETPISGRLVAGNRENLTDRALYAINLSDKVKAYAVDGTEITEGVYLSWRAFEEEFDSNNKLTTSFTVYVNGKAVKENLKATNVVLTDVSKNAEFKVVGSSDAAVNGGLKALEVKATDEQYIEMQLYKPADETMPNGDATAFTANDMSVGDVDGDGQLELVVKWYPNNSQDNSKGGYTGKTFLDTYDVNWNTGKVALLSRIDLGVNIRSGAHYTQFQVWDYDGDGKAEIAVKTADGSTIFKSEDGTDTKLVQVEGATTYVGACDTNALPTETVSTANDYRNGSGYVLSGPEYFTMFNPEEGTILGTVDYIPGRGNVSKWGDGYGNRVDRFLSATAYLDGEHPFAVMCRGYYTRTTLTAYGTKDTDNDGIGDTIYTYWAYDTDNGDGPEGQGNHNLAVADVDNDNKDEIVYGSSCYDHDGTLKYSTGLGHGDAMHVSDWIDWNEGLEVMEVHEEANQKYQVEIHDAETGEMLIGYPVSNADVGRGVAADIDPTSKGAEFWASKAADGSGTGEWDSIDSAVYGTTGSSTSVYNLLTAGSTPSVNATLYWDGDLLAEIQDHYFNNKNGKYEPISTVIAKWDYENGKQVELINSDEIFTSNGTKGNLGIIADLTGDFRDEFIARCSADDSKIRLYQTTYVTDYVVPCALDDLQYREGVAWENVAYNQPTHTSYLISKGLVTAELSEGSVATSSSVELNFTPANDGMYGYAVEAYDIYRDGKLIDTVKVDELSKVGGSASETLTAPEKLSYKFDFGAGAVAEGYTAVGADVEYSVERGYGFASLTGLSNKAYKSWNDTENAALYNDCVLGWIANGSAEFDVDLPNGTYDVTYTIANGSGAVYDAVTAEGVAFKDVRRGNSDIQATSETVTVEVTDGTLNIVNKVSKNGYAALYFTAITVEENEEAFAAKLAEYEKAVAESSNAVDETVYTYTDKNLDSNTSYSYQVAAVVNGRESYMSKAIELKTAIRIATIKDFELEDIFEGTPVKESAAELLPATVTVIDEEGKELEADVTWDVTELDITVPGTYTVNGSVKGYSELLVKTVKVVENKVKGYKQIADVKVIAGSKEFKLPETVTVEYSNTTTKAVAVVWDTTELDINTVGEYVVYGTVADVAKAVSVKVIVVEDYPVSVETTFIEIPLGSSIIDELPKTVVAKMASGNNGEVVVSWKTEGLEQIDTSVVGEHNIHGTVENLDADVLCTVSVTYPVVAKFDFGINNSISAEGWTTVTVNAKGGKKTVKDLGIEYTEEKGYGFENAAAVIEGRTESVTGNAVYPTNVTTDFALMTGQTFLVDVENGTYLVQVMTNCGIGSTSATVEVEGITQSFSANKNFTIRDYTVEVTDGQLTIVDKSSLARIGAIVVRKAHTCKAAEAVVENFVEATCTKEGSYDSVVYCSECGKEISRETVTIEKTEHKHSEAVIENTIEATCTEDGSYDSVVYCDDCGVEISRESFTVKAGHKTSETKIIKATTSSNGKIYTECTVCGEELSSVEIAAISKAELGTKTFAYDGNAKMPTITVTDVNGSVLVEGTDYDVAVSGEGVSIGEYTVTITFKGNYEGEITDSYYVVDPVTNAVIDAVATVVETVKKIFKKIIGRWP